MRCERDKIWVVLYKNAKPSRIHLINIHLPLQHIVFNILFMLTNNNTKIKSNYIDLAT